MNSKTEAPFLYRYGKNPQNQYFMLKHLIQHTSIETKRPIFLKPKDQFSKAVSVKDHTFFHFLSRLTHVISKAQAFIPDYPLQSTDTFSHAFAVHLCLPVIKPRFHQLSLSPRREQLWLHMLQGQSWTPGQWCIQYLMETICDTLTPQCLALSPPEVLWSSSGLWGNMHGLWPMQPWLDRPPKGPDLVSVGHRAVCSENKLVSIVHILA